MNKTSVSYNVHLVLSSQLASQGWAMLADGCKLVGRVPTLMVDQVHFFLYDLHVFGVKNV